MDICPIDTFCFDKTTFILFIVGLIIFITHHMGNINNKLGSLESNLHIKDHQIEKKLRKYEDKITQVQSINDTLSLANLMKTNQTAIFNNRVNNPLSPPERTYPYTKSAPINIATRGEPSEFQQVGILIQDDGTGNNQVKLPLFGQQLYPRSREWKYYTGSDGYQSVKLSVNYNGRDSMDQYGCEELYDGNTVDIKGYDSKFKVTMYKLDAPKYIPNVV